MVECQKKIEESSKNRQSQNLSIVCMLAFMCIVCLLSSNPSQDAINLYQEFEEDEDYTEIDSYFYPEQQLNAEQDYDSYHDDQEARSLRRGGGRSRSRYRGSYHSSCTGENCGMDTKTTLIVLGSVAGGLLLVTCVFCWSSYKRCLKKMFKPCKKCYKKCKTCCKSNKVDPYDYDFDYSPKKRKMEHSELEITYLYEIPPPEEQEKNKVYI